MINAHSSLTEYEHVIFVSSFISATNPDFRCSVCKVKFRTDEEKQRKHQERKGCFGKIANPLFYRGEGAMKGYGKFTTSRCFSVWSNPSYINLINYLSGAKIDLNTPAKIADWIELVNNLIEERNQKSAEIQKRFKRG